jgi:hypothetical protein
MSARPAVDCRFQEHGLILPIAPCDDRLVMRQGAGQEVGCPLLSVAGALEITGAQ